MQIKVLNDGDGCAHVTVLNEAGGEIGSAVVNANEEVTLVSDGNVNIGDVGASAPTEEPVQEPVQESAPAGETSEAADQPPVGTPAEGTPGDSSAPGAGPGEGQPGSEVGPLPGQEGQTGADQGGELPAQP